MECRHTHTWNLSLNLHRMQRINTLMHMKIRVTAFLKRVPLRSRGDRVRYKNSNNVITRYYVYIFSHVNNRSTMLTVLFKRSNSVAPYQKLFQRSLFIIGKLFSLNYNTNSSVFQIAYKRFVRKTLTIHSKNYKVRVGKQSVIWSKDGVRPTVSLIFDGSCVKKYGRTGMLIDAWHTANISSILD